MAIMKIGALFGRRGREERGAAGNGHAVINRARYRRDDVENVAFSSRFFVDETTENLLAEFEKSQAADDNANAAAWFDRLAQHRFKQLAKQRNFDPSRKSIVSVFMPKSGGTFLHNRILKLGYQRFYWCFHHRLYFTKWYAGEEALKLFLAGGCSCQTHARPCPNILAALDRSRADRIWVHLRNPAESVVSFYHHCLGEGQGEGAIGEERRKKIFAELEPLGVQMDGGKSAFVMKYIDSYAEWVALWLRFARQRPGLVAFSFYRELQDPQALFSRVFGELGVELNGDVVTEPMANDRFRKKESNDWRTDLSSEAQRHVECRVREMIGEFPAFESVWS